MFTNSTLYVSTNSAICLQIQLFVYKFSYLLSNSANCFQILLFVYNFNCLFTNSTSYVFTKLATYLVTNSAICFQIQILVYKVSYLFTKAFNCVFVCHRLLKAIFMQFSRFPLAFEWCDQRLGKAVQYSTPAENVS